MSIPKPPSKDHPRSLGKSFVMDMVAVIKLKGHRRMKSLQGRPLNCHNIGAHGRKIYPIVKVSVVEQKGKYN